jgi:putative membrane protein
LARVTLSWLSASIALWIVDHFFESLWFDGLESLFVSSLVLTLFNLTLKPVLLLLSLPFIVLSAGLAIPLINGLVLLIVAELVEGFHLSGYWMAVLAAFTFSLINFLITLATGQRQAQVAVSSRASRNRGDDDVIDVEVHEKKD